MAASASVSIAAKINGMPSGSKTIGPLFASSAAANTTITATVLVDGANTITVPTTPAPSGVIIVPPTDNAKALTLKGVTGDTGIKLSKTLPFFLPFDPANLPASFVITVTSGPTLAATEFNFI